MFLILFFAHYYMLKKNCDIILIFTQKNSSFSDK